MGVLRCGNSLRRAEREFLDCSPASLQELTATSALAQELAAICFALSSI
jgi:hypothetical protein